MQAYAIACQESGLIKIGSAKDANERLSALSVGSSELALVHHVSFDDAFGQKVERYAHWLLRGQRHHREWFSITPDQARDALTHALDSVKVGNMVPRPVKAKPKQRLPDGIKLFTVKLTDDERDKLETHRMRLGCRSQADVIRYWISGERWRDATAKPAHGQPDDDLEDLPF